MGSYLYCISGVWNLERKKHENKKKNTTADVLSDSGANERWLYSQAMD